MQDAFANNLHFVIMASQLTKVMRYNVLIRIQCTCISVSDIQREQNHCELREEENYMFPLDQMIRFWVQPFRKQVCDFMKY